jgi:hypothetical protein
MKYRSWQLGFKIREVPITFIDRTEGQSKMSKGIVKEAVRGFWIMKHHGKERAKKELTDQSHSDIRR